MESQTTKTCSACDCTFTITVEDQAYYRKLNVPPPTVCRNCRLHRRVIQVNQIHLFKRACDATGKSIISNYPSESPYQVYSQEYWYSDAFDGTKYGREYDFHRPFFEQFHELSLQVPRPALFTDYLHDENSAFTNYAGKNKNCYLIFDSDENWDCFYSFGMNYSRNSCDCYRVQNVELSYETVDSKNCFNCAFTYNSDNCSDSILLNNCIGCRSCIMCSNLRQKEYYYRNQRISKTEFDNLKRQFSSYQYLLEKIEQFNNFKLEFPQKHMRGFQNENVSGNHLVYSKNAHYCFDSMNLWDAKYCTQMFMKSKDCMDCHECGDGELLYECNNLGYNAYNIRFSQQCLSEIRDLIYCNWCVTGCSNLFGCIGLKRKNFCILNKEYSPEDYRTLVAQIIDHMESTGEWGEYFPIYTSAFPYNLTVAQEYFPLSKDEALALGCSWYEEGEKEYQVQKVRLADDIKETPDSITTEILACSTCRKNYKIIPLELKYYRDAHLPLPRKCFHCRHMARVNLRTPRNLWNRNCDHCGESIATAYAPERPETVFCDKCYLEALD